MADYTGERGSEGRPHRVARGSIGPGVSGRVDPVVRAGHLEYDRILFFTDAVFAIAITLLIVDLPVQIERHHGTIDAKRQLHDAVPGITGFAISFAVIALFWLAHHSTFRYIKAIDRPLMLLNLLFLGVIAFLPFPTELLSASSSSQMTGVAFYAACAGGAGLLETLAWWHATRAGLVEGLDRSSQRLFLVRAMRVPLTFGISIVISIASPSAATYFWLAIVVSGRVINYYYERRTGEDAMEAPADR